MSYKIEVSKLVLKIAVHSLESGLEHAIDGLANHLRWCGETTLKNKSWADTVRADIQGIEDSIGALKSVLEAPGA